jgi:hypothetical protein
MTFVYQQFLARNRLREAGVASSNLVTPTTQVPVIPPDSPSPSGDGGQRSSARLCRIPLSKGYFAVIDAADCERVSAHKWCASVCGHTVYAMRRVKGPDGKRRPVMLHRFLMDAPNGRDVDHIDGDGLNNTRANLRVVERAVNAWNRKHGAKPKGIFLDKKTGKWRSQIVSGGMRFDLGYHATPEEAREAYEAGRLRYQGPGCRP